MHGSDVSGSISDCHSQTVRARLLLLKAFDRRLVLQPQHLRNTNLDKLVVIQRLHGQALCRVGQRAHARWQTRQMLRALGGKKFFGTDGDDDRAAAP